MFSFKKVKAWYPSTESNAVYAEMMLRRVSTAIARANKLAWWKNVCLVSSLAARMMLNRRGIPSVLYLGARFKDAKSMEAHAWLKVNEVNITPPLTGFKVLYTG